jgi:hypothetical protein
MPTHIDAPHVDTHVDVPIPHVDAPHFDTHVDLPAPHGDAIPHIDLGDLPRPAEIGAAIAAITSQVEAVATQMSSVIADVARQQLQLHQAMTAMLQTGMVGMQTTMALILQQEHQLMVRMLEMLSLLKQRQEDSTPLGYETLAADLTRAADDSRGALEEARDALRERIRIARGER